MKILTVFNLRGLSFMASPQVATWLGDWRWAARYSTVLSLPALVVYFVLDWPSEGVVVVSDSGTKPGCSLVGSDNQCTLFGSKGICGELTYFWSIKPYRYCVIGYACLSFLFDSFSWWFPHLIEESLAWHLHDDLNQEFEYNLTTYY